MQADAMTMGELGTTKTQPAKKTKKPKAAAKPPAFDFKSASAALRKQTDQAPRAINFDFLGPALRNATKAPAQRQANAKPTQNPDVVRRGARVSFRARGTGRFYWSRAELDDIARRVERRAYRQVKVSSNYTQIVIEATVDQDKISLPAIRDIDMLGAIRESGSSADSAQIEFTDEAPERIAPRIPADSPNDGGGGLNFWNALGGGLGLSTPFVIGGAALLLLIAVKD